MLVISARRTIIREVKRNVVRRRGGEQNGNGIPEERSLACNSIVQTKMSIGLLMWIAELGFVAMPSWGLAVPKDHGVPR